MTPATQAVLALRAVLAIAFLIAAWSLWGHFTDWIKADEREAKEKAIESANAWKQAAENEARAKEWLNQVLVERTKREAANDRKQEGRERALENLNNPAARAQLGMRLHPDVVRESAYDPGKAGDSRLPGAQSGAAAGREAPGSGVRPGVPDAQGRAEPEKPGAVGSGQGERPDSGRGKPLPLIDRLKEKWKGAIQ